MVLVQRVPPHDVCAYARRGSRAVRLVAHELGFEVTPWLDDAIKDAIPAHVALAKRAGGGSALGVSRDDDDSVLTLMSRQYSKALSLLEGPDEIERVTTQNSMSYVVLRLLLPLLLARSNECLFGCVHRTLSEYCDNHERILTLARKCCFFLCMRLCTVDSRNFWRRARCTSRSRW
ncbi:hypothetical protein EON66_00980 [archaeon]|nr:MAG: hypothetical protein EON66_00980 [archaeon]